MRVKMDKGGFKQTLRVQTEEREFSEKRDSKCTRVQLHKQEFNCTSDSPNKRESKQTRGSKWTSEIKADKSKIDKREPK